MSATEILDAGATETLGDVRQIAALTDISQALSGTLTLKSALVRVLEILGRQHGLVRGAVIMINASGHLQVDATHGVPADRAGARYGLAEGVTARVVASNKPVVVPQVSREPLFRERLPRSEFDKREVSFICVPVTVNRRPVGAL